MISDEKGKNLHDKASRGETLTAAESKHLEEWYALQDKMEAASFGLQEQESLIADLQAQIQETLGQLIKISNRIQQVDSENEAIRQENAALRRQVTKHLGSKSA